MHRFEVHGLRGLRVERARVQIMRIFDYLMFADGSPGKNGVGVARISCGEAERADRRIAKPGLVLAFTVAVARRHVNSNSVKLPCCCWRGILSQ